MVFVTSMKLLRLDHKFLNKVCITSLPSPRSSKGYIRCSNNAQTQKFQFKIEKQINPEWIFVDENLLSSLYPEYWVL